MSYHRLKGSIERCSVCCPQDKPLPSEICVQCDIGYHCFGRNASNGCECRMCQTAEAIQGRPMLEECPKRTSFEWDHRWLSNDYDFGGEA